VGAPPFRVLLITDAAACMRAARGVVATIAMAFDDVDAPDVGVVVRAKLREAHEVAALCTALHPIVRRARAKLLVHTHARLVARLGLDGVHVASGVDPREARLALPRGALLGMSAHADDDERKRGADDNTRSGARDDAMSGQRSSAYDAPRGGALGHPDADYVVLGPVWSPGSKPRDTRAPIGVDGFARALERGTQERAVLALGGVTAKRADACMRAGAHGVAVIGAVMSAHDPRRALQGLLDVTRTRS